MTKKLSLLTLLIIAVFSLSILVAGCGAVTEKASEKAAEKAIESASGGNATVDLDKDKVSVTTQDGSMQVGGTNEWPSKIPADVPKFSYGKINSVMENTTPDGQSILVGLEDVAAADIEKYQGALEGAGWKITMTSKSDDAYFINAEKDKNTISITFGSKTDTGYSGVLGYIEGK